MNNLTFVVGRDKTFYDVSQFVTRVVWSGKRGSASRTVEVTLFCSETTGKVGGTKIDVGQGQTCVLYDVGAGITLFQGIIMSEKYNNKRQLVLTAYDVCIWLTNNKDSFTYENKRCDEIVRDCLNRLNIPVGTIQNTGHVIGELTKKATTYWDVIEDALSQTYKTRNIRYYVYSSEGRVHLVKRTNQGTMPIIDLSTNVEAYEETRSIEKTRTRLKLVTSKGETKNTTVIDSLEQKIGIFQDMQSVDEKITGAEINQRINQFRQEQGLVNRSLNVTVTGDAHVKSGGCVYVKLDTLGLARMMFVEEDVHTYENGKHSMKLKLDFATDAQEQAAAASGRNKTYKVGDIVNFHGGKHYVSSYPGSAGYSVGAGKAKITIMNGSGKAHPYHLVTQNWGQTHVWGWVDAGSFD